MRTLTLPSKETISQISTESTQSMRACSREKAAALRQQPRNKRGKGEEGREKNNSNRRPTAAHYRTLSQPSHKHISHFAGGQIRRRSGAAPQDVAAQERAAPPGALSAAHRRAIFQSRSGMLKALRHTSWSGHQEGSWTTLQCSALSSSTLLVE